ncbi:hypothetical protein Hypma_005816 [Hypsizygus marmoreus]|uniref:Uncharacterized protein n=1 Tax=Hypsizygus marmoreus TaxID=39966 RepID=A0A369KI70_HYPMA|nr:hypothetical protein Hypma_005816 [Hypsizygus marmoreus]
MLAIQLLKGKKEYAPDARDRPQAIQHKITESKVARDAISRGANNGRSTWCLDLMYATNSYYLLSSYLPPPSPSLVPTPRRPFHIHDILAYIEKVMNAFPPPYPTETRPPPSYGTSTYLTAHPATVNHRHLVLLAAHVLLAQELRVPSPLPAETRYSPPAPSGKAHDRPVDVDTQ